MRLEDKLYAYVGVKTGKLYTYLSPSPALALAVLRFYLMYEPNPKTGGYTHRTLAEVEKLVPKFRLQEYKVVPIDG